MQEIAISKFKATCLSVLENVRKTRKPILVTRFGKPVAEIVPPAVPERPASWLGSMAGETMSPRISMVPATDEDEWNALRDDAPGE